MQIAIVLGTRPEIIKMAPIIFECQKRGVPFFILHTGQHYTPNMDEVFFRELGLPAPRYNLGLGELSYRKQVGLFIKHLTEVFRAERPDVVLVQGDTISVVAGALAANKLGIKLAHHEAGLRSHDVTMLEEVNRTITDHISEFLFTPTETARRNLLEEGFAPERIYHTGNTIVDIMQKHDARIATMTTLADLSLSPKRYFLVTAHRAENVDHRQRLQNIFEGLTRIKRTFPEHDIIFPMHPRTKNRCEAFGLSLDTSIRVIEPMSYFAMLNLQKNARLIITDSGGMQEEACVLQVPVVTIRDTTERPETVELGFNTLVPGVAPDAILRGATTMLERAMTWSNPFGDGKAAERIIGHLSQLL